MTGADRVEAALRRELRIAKGQDTDPDGEFTIEQVACLGCCTLAPVVRIDAGDQALFYGDYDTAREQYLAAYNDSTDVAVKAAALWGLGRTELADENYQAALERFTALSNEYPESTYSARAPFLMARAYAGLGQYTQAADAYNTYMTRITREPKRRRNTQVSGNRSTA